MLQSKRKVRGSLEPAGSVAWATMFPLVDTLASGIGATWKRAVIVGATLFTLTVTGATVQALGSGVPLSQTWRRTVGVAGPSRPLKVTFCPSVSKSTLLSRSQAKVTLELSMSEPLPFSVMLEPSSTV